MKILDEFAIEGIKLDIPKAKFSVEDKAKLDSDPELKKIVEFILKGTVRKKNPKNKFGSDEYWNPLFNGLIDDKNEFIKFTVKDHAYTLNKHNSKSFNGVVIKLALIILTIKSVSIKQLIESNLKEMSQDHKFGKFVGEILEQENIPDNQKNRQDMSKRIIDKNVADIKDLIKNNPEYGKDIDPDTVKRLLMEKLLGSGGGEDEGEGEGEGQNKVPSMVQGAAQGENETDLDWLKRRFREFRQYLEKADAQTKDVVSTATYKNAGKMLSVGIPKEAIVHSYALTWPERVRMELDIPSWNPQMFGEAKPGQHKAVPYVEALVKAGVPAMLVGPTQAGKGYLSRNIAENMGLQYGSVPLSAGTSIAWLFGRNMPQGFVSTDFVRCYENGGVFLLDEMDAADSNLLLGINDALSNNELANPVIDMRIPKHEMFIPLAAANTFGLGADADYTGRERLDMATLERWRMGRVEIDYDRAMQERILDEEALIKEEIMENASA